MPIPFRNLTLIGMPGSGKSTIGQGLARRWGFTLVDTDERIETGEGKRLEEIIDAVGFDRFLQIEADYVQREQGEQKIISTGGSVIYVDAAMQHLRAISTVVYIDVPLSDLEQRLGDLKARGVVIAPGRTLKSLWEERHPLYVKYAHLSVVCEGDDPAASVDAIANALT